jgi:hypothetical protein
LKEEGRGEWGGREEGERGNGVEGRREGREEWGGEEGKEGGREWGR